MRSAAILLLGLLAAPASAGTDVEAYRVTLDLGDSIRLLANDDAFQREPAETLLAALGAKALPALSAALDREDVPIRLGIVEVLTSVDGDGATALLLQRAKTDSAVDVRAAAISGLVSRVDPEAGEVVPDALASDDPRLHRAAFAGCARYCISPEELDRLVAFVFSEPLVYMAGPRGALLRGAASNSHRPSVVAAVERGAAPRLEDPDPEIRLRAAMLFADLEDPRAVAPLSQALDRDVAPLLRVQAIVALGSLGNEASVKKIGDSLDSLPPGVRAAACKALATLAHRGVAGAEEAADRGCSPA